MEHIIKNQYGLKELELNALLEITQAINNNLPEESLYKIYNFTLQANLELKKLALYVLNDQAETPESSWECKTKFGTNNNFFNQPINENLLQVKSITNISEVQDPGLFSEFDIMIPVAHKETILAYVFVGGLQKDDGSQPETETTFLQAISNIIIVAIENKKLARKQLRQEAMRKELEIASRVQQFLFPKSLPYKEGFKIVASYIPHHSVGGDYYDYIPITATHFMICIADVAGKGVPAALLMSNFQATLRTLARQTMNLKEIVEELNFQILQSANGENFITFFIGLFDMETNTLRYINAGHNPPLLIDADRNVHLLEYGTTVLGSFHPLPFLEEGIMSDLQQFFFFAYTDGLTETFNEENEEFGLMRVQKFLMGNDEKDLHLMHEKLLKKLEEFSGNKKYNDDVTLISMEVDTTKIQNLENSE